MTKKKILAVAAALTIGLANLCSRGGVHYLFDKL